MRLLLSGVGVSEKKIKELVMGGAKIIPFLVGGWLFWAGGIEGVTYQFFSEGFFSAIHVLVVDPQEELILPVKALEEKGGRETVCALALRHGALAAVNGGFWRANGEPAGARKFFHEWDGEALFPRGAVGWSEGGREVVFDQILTQRNLETGSLEAFPAFFPSPTREEEWEGVEHILGGAPLLLSEGKEVREVFREEISQKFWKRRHPRTALGVREDGCWVFVVVDGRFFWLFGGMTGEQLRAWMVRLGCVEALNLDGGASSTLVIDGRVVNTPCGALREKGKRVTAVSDALLILPRDSSAVAWEEDATSR